VVQESRRPNATTAPSVEYHSYLLRLRQTREGSKTIRQAYLREIPSDEEFYFRSLKELVDFLCAQGPLRWEMAWDEEDEAER